MAGNFKDRIGNVEELCPKLQTADEESGHAFDIEKFLARSERQFVAEAHPVAVALVESGMDGAFFEVQVK